MIYLSKGGAGADSDHTWIRPCYFKLIFQNVSDNLEIQLGAFLFCCFGANELRCIIYVLLQVSETLKFS